MPHSRTPRLSVLTTIFALLAIHVSALFSLANDWQAGVAKIKITPEKFMWMSGYGGRNKPADGKLTDLWAKALVIQDGGGKQAALITLDLVGIDRELSQSVCQALATQCDLNREQIAICTSHTHTGPVVGKNLRSLHYDQVDEKQQALIDEYAESLQEKIVAVVGSAIKDLQPSQLSWGSGTATFAANRRNNSEAKVPELREQGLLKGPFDHDVPVLAVRGNDKGELKALVFGYACHCTVLSLYQWSGDYAGFAQIELEKVHPDCVALFWAGCGGDQNPLPRRTVELAREYGQRLAAAVNRVLENDMGVIEGTIDTRYAEVELPFGEIPTREQLQQSTQSKNRYEAARAKMLLEKLKSDGTLASTYPYPVQCWRLGKEIQFIALGGEVVVDFAIRLKSELRDTRTWVAGYSNDVMAYIASRRVLLEGRYEGGGAMVYYGQPTVWALESEEVIVKEVHRQIKLGN